MEKGWKYQDIRTGKIFPAASFASPPQSQFYYRFFDGAASSGVTFSCNKCPLSPFELAEMRAEKVRIKKRKRQQQRRRKLAEQAKVNKAAGSRFERAVVLAFQARGLDAERVDETHGFSRGWDIFVKSLPKMVVQCKATSTAAALLNGLAEAREHNPNELFWVCFHSYRPKGKPIEIRVAFSSRPSGPASIADADGFFHVLMLAHLSGRGYPDA